MSADEDGDTTVDPVTFARGDGSPMLEIVDGPGVGRRLPLERPVTVLGKGSSADVRFRASGISREHAKLVLAADGIVNLVDLGSTNGTFVNQARIDVALVRPGDRIQLGAHLTLALVPPSKAQPEGEVARLTARQLEVARLVAVGSTNAEVARALGVTTRTVSSHLERIYQQLGIASRVELTRWLIEHGLHDDPVG